MVYILHECISWITTSRMRMASKFLCSYVHTNVSLSLSLSVSLSFCLCKHICISMQQLEDDESEEEGIEEMRMGGRVNIAVNDKKIRCRSGSGWYNVNSRHR